VFPVRSDLSDAELGVVPCSFGTAENMLSRAGVFAGQHVLVTGASGGVGTAAVQLARLRGAEVTAMTTAGKATQVRELGAARVLDRGDDVVAVLGEQSIDVVVDNVCGPGLDGLLALLRRGGVYASSGAIAGAQVTFDKRTFYLRDLTLLGCTAWGEAVFPALVERLERHELRPPVAAVFPLERIAEAQTEFLEKRHVGSYALVPPGL
jgi:NADPH:quinone reductase-like Zn-dependent oxidoreductase